MVAEPDTFGNTLGALLIFGPVLGCAIYLAWLFRREQGHLLVPPAGRHASTPRHDEDTPVAESVDESAAQQVPSLTVAATLAEMPEVPASAVPAAVAAPAADGGAASTRELVAPVEMWFGTTCVGVARGTDTHQRFERYASELLADLVPPEPPVSGSAPPERRGWRWFPRRLRARSGYARSG